MSLGVNGRWSTQRSIFFRMTLYCGPTQRVCTTCTVQAIKSLSLKMPSLQNAKCSTLHICNYGSSYGARPMEHVLGVCRTCSAMLQGFT